MLLCGPGDRDVVTDVVSDRGTTRSARNSGSVHRTINLMSRRTLVVVFATAILGAAVVLLVFAGDRGGSVKLPLERPPPTSALKASISKKKSDESQTNGNNDTGSTSHTPGTEGGGTRRRTSRALEEQQEVLSSTAPKPTMNVRRAEDQHPRGRVAIFVYAGVPELDHKKLVQCYRSGHRGVSPWQDERNDMAENMGEIWMHRAILSHPWRVLDPEEADLFYIPIYSALSSKLTKHRCGGLPHMELMDASVEYLSSSSLFFNRFGGADHVLMCAWWGCRNGLGPKHRMMLRRTVVGINERVFKWTRWGCGPGRMVTVPYTASSVLATSDMIGGRTAEDRDIPFFFVGTARGRPERQNLDVVADIAEGSVVVLGELQSRWGMNSTLYAEHMARSRFCFSPRGDTESSRRLFDAIAAGCTPIVTESTVPFLPFSETAVNYSDFAVVVDSDGFSSRELVKGVVRDVLSRSAVELAKLREGARMVANELLYGITVGPKLNDMRPFFGTATNFARESYALVRGRGKKGEMRSADMWSCPETRLKEEWLAPRTSAQLPPHTSEIREWLAESETILVMDRSLLFCAAPNTGSLQFRMLAKRMQGVPHWSVSNNRSLLFDRAASELELLDTTDGRLMKEIYSDNGSGWIKIAVVRDPVTRLLSSYLDLVDTWRAGLIMQPPGNAAQSSDHNRRWLWQWRREAEPTDEDRQYREVEEEAEFLWNDPGGWHTPGAAATTAAPGSKRGEGKEGGDNNRDNFAEENYDVGDGGHAVRIPTFVEVLEALKTHVWSAPGAFRPVSSLCGQRRSPFDSVIPFERLQKTSTEVVKSLPGDIWEAFGKSGWGPGREHAFMDFDYGRGAWRGEATSGGAGNVGNGIQREEGDDMGDPLPRHARDLFEGEDPCAWTKYYSDVETLDAVGMVYEMDYIHYRWYQLDLWKKRLKDCLARERGGEVVDQSGDVGK